MFFIDRKFRLPRYWSNQEIKKIAPCFNGDIVNVSAWDDRDKQGKTYKDYFINARSYSLTNYSGFRGYQNQKNEYHLDLTKNLPEELVKKFDVAFNHTTLEHIFDVNNAFANICNMTRDILILVVPFSQAQHESDSWKDYWRFTPSCLRRLFDENRFTVVYEAESNLPCSGIYLLFVGSRYPEKWKDKLPSFKPIIEAGQCIGSPSRLVLFLQKPKQWIKKVANTINRNRKTKTFSQLSDINLKRRDYKDYDEYIKHQGEKLLKKKDEINKSDHDYEVILTYRLKKIDNFKGKSVLCLGARLGGEVRAFKTLGALAIGIDVEPGGKNPHVMFGDFHDLKFPDASFDVAFTNAIDHVYHLEEFLKETLRILKPGGFFYIELAMVSPGEYEVLDTLNPEPIISELNKYFKTVSIEEIYNKTDYIDWKGKLFCLKKD